MSLVTGTLFIDLREAISEWFFKKRACEEERTRFKNLKARNTAKCCTFIVVDRRIAKTQFRKDGSSNIELDSNADSDRMVKYSELIRQEMEDWTVYFVIDSHGSVVALILRS